MNPYVILTVLAVLFVTHTGAFLKGRSYEESKQKAAYSKQLEKAISDANENAAIDMQAAFEVGKKQAKVRVVTQTIREQVDKVVEKPVYRDCRLDPDGLYLWNAASAGSLTAPTGKPDTAPARLPPIN